MHSQIKITAALALGLAALISIGCEDSGITAPEGSTITLIASPSAVTINQDVGETRGITTIVAQLLDDRGLPLENVPLFFSSSGGFLSSVQNACLPTGTCSRSGEVCLTDDDCPFLAPVSIETDASGVATDILVLRLIEDPDSVEVTVNSTASSSSVTVTKNVNTGPQDPVANISPEPAGGQRTGFPFSFNGTGTTFDPRADITCWEWTISSSIPINNSVTRGPDLSILTIPGLGDVDNRADEQDLTVELRVTDVQGVSCSGSQGPPSSAFSVFSDVVSYQIRCDFTIPSVEAGSNRFETLSGAPDVSVSLTATGSDPESPALTYFWDCGTAAQNFVPGQSVTCVYDTTGIFTARVTAENACGLQNEDSLTVTINP